MYSFFKHLNVGNLINKQNKQIKNILNKKLKKDYTLDSEW